MDDNLIRPSVLEQRYLYSHLPVRLNLVLAIHADGELFHEESI